MPPANKHLQWIDLSEFGGLWTAGAGSLMPANRAQVMSGCHPQPGGGLRAFLKVGQTVAGTGMVSTYLNLPGGASDWASTPALAVQVTEPLTIQALVALNDWTPAAAGTFFSNYHAATNTGLEFGINTSGQLLLRWGTGAATITRTCSAATGIADGTKKWVRATMDGDVSGSHQVKFFTSDNGRDWTQVGTTSTTAGVSSVAYSSQQARVGARPDGTLIMAGKLWKVTIANFIAGSFEFLRDSTGTDIVYQGPDFRSGLGASTVTDYEANGGPAVWTLSGNAAIVTDSTAEVPIGFGVSAKANSSTPFPAQVFPGAATLFVVTADTGSNPLAGWKLWRRELDDASQTRWLHSQNAQFSLLDSISTTPPAGQPTFARVAEGVDGTGWDVVAVPIQGANDDAAGVYTIKTAYGLVKRDETNGTTARRAAATSVVEHQSRLVVGYKDIIVFTAPTTGVISFSAAGSGYVRLNPEGFSLWGGAVREGAMVAWMVSVPPGDLIVATRDGRIYNVQGDLSDPTVRELGRWTTTFQHEPALTPNGVFFILPNHGVARLGLDGSAEVVSQGINPAIWNPTAPKVGLGQLAGTERYVFCPNLHQSADHKNGALVFDLDTGAWFTSTHADDYTITNPRFIRPDNNPQDSGIWMLTSAAPETQGTSNPIAFQIRTGGYKDADLTNEQRNSTWEWKSAPLREPEGNHHLDIREVVIPAYAFNDNTSTLAVTVGGTTVSKTLPAGRSIQTYTFRARDKVLDIKVKAKSNNTSVEAPLIEGLRAGWRKGPPLR